MPRIQLEVRNDLVQRLDCKNDPVKAFVDFVWNNLGPDAHDVVVEPQRNDADGVIGFEVAELSQDLPTDAVTDVLATVQRTESPVVESENWRAHRFLTQGVPVKIH